MKKKGISRLLEIAGERKGFLFLSGILSFISAVLMLTPYASTFYILRELFINLNDLSNVNAELMKQWGMIALAGIVGGLIFLYLSLMASHIAAFRILYGLRVNLSDHIGRLHLGYLTRSSTGAIKKTLEQNVEKIELFIAHQIPDLVSVIATAFILFAIMTSLNIWMALSCIAAIVIGFAIMGSMMVGEKADSMMKGYYNALERINASAIEYVKGMPAVKIFGRTVFSFRKFHKDMVDYSRLATDYSNQFQNGYVLFKTVLASFLAFILPVGALLLSGAPHDRALAVVVLFFLIMAPGATAPLYKIMYLSSSLRDISEGVERIDAIFSQPPVKEPEVGKKPGSCDVEFVNVTFCYDSPESETRVEALSNVSFKAPAGTITALVGPSGSGKTTTANLIPRFWDVTEGSIRIGGIDIREIRTADLMEATSFVFQDAFLFYDSLYANILVGKPNASREEVIEAARAAQCHEFIERLPRGYDTLIGEGGVYLSGGEEQRVAVARAILKNAPILVLDEATAFADPENEYKMQAAINTLIKNKTVIIIAHRLSTIRNADNIVVLSEGRVVETGRHQELLTLDGVYKKMWNVYVDAAGWGINRGYGGADNENFA